MSGVDVLAVMAGLIDEAAMDGAITQGQELIEALAAVAELLDIAGTVACAFERVDGVTEANYEKLTAALAACGAPK